MSLSKTPASEEAGYNNRHTRQHSNPYTDCQSGMDWPMPRSTANS
jgi:hypothetical protein